MLVSNSMQRTCFLGVSEIEGFVGILGQPGAKLPVVVLVTAGLYSSKRNTVRVLNSGV